MENSQRRMDFSFHRLNKRLKYSRILNPLSGSSSSSTNTALRFAKHPHIADISLPDIRS